MIEKLRFCKVRDTKNPSRAHSTDAGIDVYSPNDEPTYALNIGDSVLINTGIKFEVPKGYMLTAFNKSGIATKKGLLVGASVVDSMYSGCVHVNLHKVSGGTTYIKPGEKIVQFILIPISSCSLEEIEEKDLYNGIETERGEGGFGSSGMN